MQWYIIKTSYKICDCKTVVRNENIFSAAVAYGPGQALVVEEIRVDPPLEMEVRVRILFTSVCHTDLTYWLGQVYVYIFIYVYLLVILM